MRLPRLITRRRVKWVGLVLTGLFAGVLIASIWISAGRFSDTSQFAVARTFGISRGGVRLGRVSSDMGWSEDMIGTWIGFDASGAFVWWPTYREVGPWSMRAEVYQIPLWPVVALFGVPTAYLWHTDRRAKPWQCATCRYDLRGLDGGVCPECGACSQRSEEKAT